MIIPYYLPNLGMGAGGSIAPTGPATLREAVRARLAETDSLTAKVGGRIYHFAIPQSKAAPTLPAVTYYVASRSYGHHLRGSDGTSLASVRISCWSRNEAEADSMAQIIRDRMDSFQGLWGQVEVLGSFLEDETDLPEYPRNGTDDYTYQIALTVTVIHRISIPTFA